MSKTEEYNKFVYKIANKHLGADDYDIYKRLRDEAAAELAALRREYDDLEEERKHLLTVIEEIRQRKG